MDNDVERKKSADEKLVENINTTDAISTSKSVKEMSTIQKFKNGAGNTCAANNFNKSSNAIFDERLKDANLKTKADVADVAFIEYRYFHEKH